jgi:hypothetical protein
LSAWLGATLLHGDGCITPAISVLSAIEGLKIYAPQLKHAVLPLTVAILLGPFLIQRRGTGFIACPKTGNPRLDRGSPGKGRQGRPRTARLGDARGGAGWTAVGVARIKARLAR